MWPFGKNKKKEKELSYGEWVGPEKKEKSYKHNLLEAIWSNISLIPESREKIRRLLNEKEIAAFYLPREKVVKDVSDIISKNTISKIEGLLGKEVFLENTSLGLFLAFKKEEEPEEIIKKIEGEPSLRLGKETLKKLLKSPIDEEKAKDLIGVIKKSRKTRSRLVKAITGARKFSLKRSWVLRVRPKGKPV